MASFPIPQFSGPIRTPDPQSTIVDYAGAFNTALNTAVKFYQLGLENQWKERSAQLAEQRLALDRAEMLGKLDIAEADMRIRRDDLAVRREQIQSGVALRDAQVAEAKAKTSQLNFDLQKVKDADEAAMLWGQAKSTDADFLLYDQGRNMLIASTDFVDRGKLMEQLPQLANETLAPKAAQWRALSAKNQKLAPEIEGTLNSTALIRPESDRKVYLTNIPLTKLTVTSPDASGAARAFNNMLKEDVPPDKRDELLALVSRNEVKEERVPGQYQYWSHNETMQRARSGDMEAYKVILNNSGDKAAAFREIQRLAPASTNLGELYMYKNAVAAGLTGDDLQAYNRPTARVSGAVSDEIAKWQGQGIKADDPVKRPKLDLATNREIPGQFETVMTPEGKPLTYGDRMGMTIASIERNDAISPADKARARQVYDEWRAQSKPKEPEKPIGANAAFAPDMTVDDALKIVVGKTATVGKEALDSLWKSTPIGAANELRHKKLSELKPSDILKLGGLPLSQLSGIARFAEWTKDQWPAFKEFWSEALSPK